MKRHQMHSIEIDVDESSDDGSENCVGVQSSAQHSGFHSSDPIVLDDLSSPMVRSSGTDVQFCEATNMTLRRSYMEASEHARHLQHELLIARARISQLSVELFQQRQLFQNQVLDMQSGAATIFEPLCQICKSNIAKHAAVPCGHRSLCFPCSTTAELSKCPVCRTPATAWILIY
jgi:hypothetical protein